MEFLDKLSSLGFHLKWKFAKTLGKESFKKEKRTRKLDGQKETKNRKGLQRVTKKGGWTLRRGTWAASSGDEAATLRGWTDRRAETAEPPHAALPGPRPPSVQLPSYPAWTAALSWSQDSSGSSFQRHSFLKGTVTTTEHFKQSLAKFCLHTRQQKRKRMCSLLAPCRTRPAGATSLTNTVLSVQFPPKGQSIGDNVLSIRHTQRPLLVAAASPRRFSFFSHGNKAAVLSGQTRRTSHLSVQRDGTRLALSTDAVRPRKVSLAP